MPSETDAPTQAASRTFRYSVQGSDGTVRTVTEQVHLNVDGFVAETTISFNAESEAEATWFLDDAKAQFDDAWVSGSVQGTQAIFTLLPARTDLNAEAYEALLTSNITDFTVLQ